MIRVINTYFEGNTADISIDTLAVLFFASYPDHKEYYATFFDQLTLNEADTSSVELLVQRLHLRNLCRELSLTAYEVSEGKKPVASVIDKLGAINQIETSTKDDVRLDFEFVSDDLEALVASSVNEPGLNWRLLTLQKMLGPLRKGDFGFVFARPEVGKTTFLACEITHMAHQLTEDAGPVLWFNNEEQGNKVMLRCYQSVLDCDLISLYSDLITNKNKFYKHTRNKIKLHDSGQISKNTVATLCARLKPSLIIFDQIDKIQGFENDRDDLKLGAIYQWARELAKTYAPVIGICQADGSAEGMQWLTMNNVANAKTAKQAEADWILGIGKKNDVGYDNIRYLHLSKNKLFGGANTDPDLRHGRMEVLIDANKARYRDIHKWAE